MKLEDAKPGMRVRYMPQHAFGDRSHRDVELGTVSSVNSKNVFVKFDRYIRNDAPGQACYPSSLEALKPDPLP